ncbi:MAG: hypothetical protein HRU18_14110 [Pseudoalteromonas sp.]|uniref:hypothetical protein n=1 Tax=Pseudoalteromonas sp. TaxID=53249 RepID=UPI001E09372F|nr:hypothetical protein [Pseudoalteromonas sp.]NRA79338.1 hypothetical protein [Pseudoalteromonas sp.]
MAHNILVLSMSTIPQSAIDLNSRFDDGVFNADRTKRQIDGYAVDENENIILPKALCHAQNYLLYLCRGEVDPSKSVQSIIDSSYELNVSDYQAMKADVNSEWYTETEGEL